MKQWMTAVLAIGLVLSLALPARADEKTDKALLEAIQGLRKEVAALRKEIATLRKSHKKVEEHRAIIIPGGPDGHQRPDFRRGTPDMGRWGEQMRRRMEEWRRRMPQMRGRMQRWRSQMPRAPHFDFKLEGPKVRIEKGKDGEHVLIIELGDGKTKKVKLGKLPKGMDFNWTEKGHEGHGHKGHGGKKDGAKVEKKGVMVIETIGPDGKRVRKVIELDADALKKMGHPDHPGKRVRVRVLKKGDATCGADCACAKCAAKKACGADCACAKCAAKKAKKAPKKAKPAPKKADDDGKNASDARFY